MKAFGIVLFLLSFPVMTSTLKSQTAPVAYDPSYLDSLAIEIPPGEARPYLFSGYGEAFFYGTTAAKITAGHMGFYWGEYKLWRDFQILIGGQKLDRAKAIARYLPDRLVFSWADGIRLTILPLFRDRNFLRFQLTGVPSGELIQFYLQLDQPGRVISEGNLQSVCGEQGNGDSLWFGVGPLNTETFAPPSESPEKGEGEVLRQEAAQGEALLAQSSTGQLDLAFIYANSAENLQITWKDINVHPEVGTADRREWLLQEINRAYFRCADAGINQALNWAKISLAQLWSEDETALWAGLPWFNDCWGRDTFISLPGACLVQGKFAQAKALLQRFARWQCRDSTSTDWGRVPNRARFGDISYNTADGTPWFVRSVYEYGFYSGDRELWEAFLSPGGAVFLANEGTLKYHTDSLGFLTHGDAETWMDAVGTEGAWTPRGDRAIEVQALWLAQLEASLKMAQACPDLKLPEATTERWQRVILQLRQNIPKKYLRPEGLGLYDHLNADGTADQQIRPNQLFALTVPLQPLFDETTEESLLKIVRDSLVYPYGVASLSQTDAEFHPYHQYYLYPKDAAYHNGTVWTWLSGPFESATNGGWRLVQSEMDLILNRGACGTLPELLDAVPQTGADFPRPSGTVSQTWSLAEFLRTWYQDYVGLKPDLSAQQWLLQPRLPRDWGDFSVLLNVQGNKILFHMQASSDTVTMIFRALDISAPADEIQLFSVNSLERIDFRGSGMIEYHFPREGNWITFHQVAAGVGASRVEEKKCPLFLPEEGPDDYLKPAILPGLKALQPPDHPLLSGEEIKAVNPAAQIVADVDDPVGDDVGEGGYVYPTEAHFRPGILDLTHFRVSCDAERLYFQLNFRDLVQPGWHPEYGFQLTFITIAIRSAGPEAETRREVGRNSGWVLPDSLAADRFIHISGPLLIEDASGHILGEYLPTDPNFAPGDMQDKNISFSLPRSLISGDPARWRFTVLVGSQDDHGGAGLGEFRQVNAAASRWAGGGGGPNRSNVYDVLIYP